LEPADEIERPMDRRDLLWIALKLAGLYLIAEGVLCIPVAVVDGGLLHKLDAGVPLLAGCILLGIRITETGGVERSAVPGGMNRGDWFWLVCKSLGLWWTVHALLQVPMTIRSAKVDGTEPAVLVSVGMYLAAGLCLLLTDVVPRLVGGAATHADRSAR
jgi:hypothetical protein